MAGTKNKEKKMWSYIFAFIKNLLPLLANWNTNPKALGAFLLATLAAILQWVLFTYLNVQVPDDIWGEIIKMALPTVTVWMASLWIFFSRNILGQNGEPIKK